MADIDFIFLVCYLYIEHWSRVVCVHRNDKVMCTLSTLSYNTVQTFQEMLL